MGEREAKQWLSSTLARRHLAARERHQLRRQLRVAVGRHVAAAERVALRSVEAGGHQHEVGLKLGGDGHEDLTDTQRAFTLLLYLKSPEDHQDSTDGGDNGGTRFLELFDEFELFDESDLIFSTSVLALVEQLTDDALDEGSKSCCFARAVHAVNRSKIRTLLHNPKKG